jgi:hypothetical protein
MTLLKPHSSLGTAGKIGVWLLVYWGVLHMWVGAEGVHQYLRDAPRGLWQMMIGGSVVSRDAFQNASDAVTLFAHSQLLINFCLDVGGYGVLGVLLAAWYWHTRSVMAFVLALVVIGIADLSFLFAMLVSGVIEPNLPTVSGPIIWFFACGFMLADLRRRNSEKPVS